MQIKKEFKGNIGLFLVCAELSKRNLIVMPTSRNTKGYDLVVLEPKANKSIAIQVKCTDKKDFPILNSHWCNYKMKIKEKILADFIFVDISNVEEPRYFVLTKMQIRNTIRTRIRNYIRQYQEKHAMTLEQMLQKEKEQNRKPDLWTLKLTEIDKFEDEWQKLVKKIRK